MEASTQRYRDTRERSIGLRGAALALAIFVAGCGPDGPVAPDDLRRTFGNGARVVSLAENGQTYTLDLDASQLRDGSGRIVQLTSAQLSQFATLYDEVLYSDYLDSELASAPVPEPPMCGPNPCYEEIRARGRPDVSAPTPWVFAGGRIRVWHNAFRGLDRSPASPFGLMNGVESISESATGTLNSEFPPNCYEIAMAIYTLRSELKTHRGVIVGTLASLFAALSFTVQNGALVAEMPGAFWLGVGLEYVAAEQLTRSFALQFLAAQYSGYGCWTNNWDRRDYFEGGVTAQSNSSIQKTCYDDVIGIWFDGVLHYFNGQVCDVEWVD